MNKIFIAGGGGMLGEGMYRVLSKNHNLKITDKNLTSSWIENLDFRNFDEYRRQVLDYRPNWLFHIGAHTSLEFCEQNKDDAYLTNTISVEYATKIANELSIPILYISTAGIFDGLKDQYDDWDQPNPLGVYARSKYMGERFVIENANQYIICRAGWMMGGGESKDKKFVNKIIQQIKGGTNQLFVVSDKDGTPTYTHDFAATVEILTSKKAFGLYNCVCEGMTSRFEVAQHLLKILNRNDIKINKVSSDYFSQEYFAIRPASERLISSRLRILNINTMRDWKTALESYIKEYYS